MRIPRIFTTALVGAAIAVTLGTGPAGATGPRAVPAGAEANSATALKECGVRAHDGRLWCGNRGEAPVRREPYHESDFIGELFTTFSWFDCWATGGLHGGGNTTWYHTTPDWGDPGYIPGDWVFTPSWFDADPSRYGLRHC
ncbi:hypothetical protein B4N89_10695 [Embleya scabrispora]|uniref:Uncharacterized protein n=1 Tax=Embleya scabrispora TaxID=159449 RepID=A0A1T3NXF8_9ACTN|nr:hypothetical protein [Embleya scabrispora]OPC81351.1 hypothetical protein B4N89_10695 [Embleya scabrispora]